MFQHKQRRPIQKDRRFFISAVCNCKFRHYDDYDYDNDYEIQFTSIKVYAVNNYKTVTIIITIIIIIVLHGLGRLTCSGIDALPSFPGASTISSSSRFVVEGVFRPGVVHSFKVVDPRLWCVVASEYFVFLGRVTNPSAIPPFLEDQFVLVWPLSYALSSLRGPTRNIKLPPA